MAKLVITIDGPAASGKSTVARLVAARLGASFLDTGAMYRAVTLAGLKRRINMADEMQLLEVVESSEFQFSLKDGVMAVFLDGEDVSELIRRPEVTAESKYAARFSKVRQRLVDMQRQFAAEVKNLVTEGRDQGTVAFPDADAKFYLTASIDERARRRRVELKKKGCVDNIEKIAAKIAERDKNDRSREVGPLKAAEGAVVIDTTELSVEEVVEKIVDIVKEKRQRSCG